MVSLGFFSCLVFLFPLLIVSLSLNLLWMQCTQFMDTKSCTHPSTKKDVRKGPGCPSIQAPALLQPQGDSERELTWIKFAGFNLVDMWIILLLVLWIQKFMLCYRAESGWSKNHWEVILHWSLHTGAKMPQVHVLGRNIKGIRRGLKDLIPRGVKFFCNLLSWIFITARTNTVSWEVMLKIQFIFIWSLMKYFQSNFQCKVLITIGKLLLLYSRKYFLVEYPLAQHWST